MSSAVLPNYRFRTTPFFELAGSIQLDIFDATRFLGGVTKARALSAAFLSMKLP